MNKQKVPPVLALFCNELTTALQNEYGNEAKSTWSLLRIIIDYIIQPLLTITTSKGLKVKEAMVFTSLEDIQLKYFKEISN